MYDRIIEEMESLRDREVVGYLLFGEARGEPAKFKKAVVDVIRNRAAGMGWFGNTIKAVCLKPRQFSCFNEEDRNLVDMLVLSRQQHTILGHLMVEAGEYLEDPPRIAGGATYYHHVDVDPPWAEDMIVTLETNEHKFYREKEDD